MTDLDGKHAIVTGGSRGIGAAIAAELARLGAAITLMGRNRDALAAQAEKLRAECHINTATAHCDVSSDESVANAFAQALETFGPPYVLVNNAGVGDACEFFQVSRSNWDSTLAVNLTGTFLCAQHALPGMVAKQEGRIINIASTAGLKGYHQLSAYCASKHGVIGLTRALALEFARHSVTVNAVCPTYCSNTGMGELAIENVMHKLNVDRLSAMQRLVRAIPIGRLVTPEEVASVVGWLCSPEASAVTGQSIVVAGGEVMC